MGLPRGEILREKRQISPACFMRTALFVQPAFNKALMFP
jgi:hypothetical protein